MTETRAKRPTVCVGCAAPIHHGDRLVVSTEGKHCSLRCALDTKSSDRACLSRTDQILAFLEYGEGVREAIRNTEEHI